MEYREFKKAKVKMMNEKIITREVRKVNGQYYATFNRGLIDVIPNGNGIFLEIDSESPSHIDYIAGKLSLADYLLILGTN